MVTPDSGREPSAGASAAARSARIHALTDEQLLGYHRQLSDESIVHNPPHLDLLKTEIRARRLAPSDEPVAPRTAPPSR